MRHIRKQMFPAARFVWCLALIAAPAAGQGRATTREMATDRPDKTESPVPVPSGWWQVEMDMASWARTAGAGGASTSLDVAALNLKRGIHARADLQLLIVPFRRERDGSGRATTGAGEVAARVKLNLAGLEGGRIGFGLMPFVQLAPGVGRVLEGGLIAPLSVALAPGWDLGTMAEVDVAGDAHDVVLVHSVTLGRDFGAGFGAYAEIFQAVTPSLPAGRWLATFDLGATKGLGDHVQLDAGVNLGLTETAEDANPFLGLSFRF